MNGIPASRGIGTGGSCLVACHVHVATYTTPSWTSKVLARDAICCRLIHVVMLLTSSREVNKKPSKEKSFIAWEVELTMV